MADRETLKAIVENDTGPISVWEFSHFLYLFRAAYAAALSQSLDSGLYGFNTEDQIRDFADKLRDGLHELSALQVARLAREELPVDLTILQISHRSPLEIVFGGVLIALAAAVILSGGEFKAGPVRVKLPPLGTGIAALRAAFGKQSLPPRRSKRLR